MGTLKRLWFSGAELMRPAGCLLFCVCVFGFVVCVQAQSAEGEQDEPPRLFSLLVLVKAPAPCEVKIGRDLVGIGQMPYGFYTGPVSWYPEETVTLAAEGFETGEIQPDGAAPRGVCPLYIAYDVTEKSPSDGSPVKKIKVLKVPMPSSRPETAIDAFNFNAAEDLTIKEATSSVSLPRLKRVRLSTRLPFSAQVVPDGPEIGFGIPEEGGGMAVLVVFYEDASGSVTYVVTRG
jgi:hypothetical protein